METPGTGQGIFGRPPISKGKEGNRVPGYLYLALFFLLVCINALVAKFVVFSFNFAPGTAYLYVVIAFMVVFALWFGMYGAIAAYVGCFIGAGLLSGIPPDINVIWSLTDFWEAFIPLIAFRTLGCDPAIRSRRDFIVLILSGVIFNNVAGAVWGTGVLALGGEIAWDSFIQVCSVWLVGNIIVCIILVPVMLRFITPFLEKHELYVKRYWH